MSTKVANKTLMWPLGIALSLLLFTACLKDGDDTLVLPQPDGKIPDEVIPTNLQDSLRIHGFDIYEGVEPPDITGTFVINPMEQIYTSDDTARGLNYEDLWMTFSEFWPRGIVKYKESQENPRSGHSTGQSIEANVIGHDDLFTAYCWQIVEKRDVNTGQLLSKHKLATVVSGSMTTFGIVNCKYALIVLDKETFDEQQHIRSLEPDTYQTYEDGNGKADRY